MSAALSDTEAEMLTRGREPEDRSSAGGGGRKVDTDGSGSGQLMGPGSPSRSSGGTSAEELFTGRVSPARSDFSWTRSGFSAQRTLEGTKTEAK